VRGYTDITDGRKTGVAELHPPLLSLPAPMEGRAPASPCVPRRRRVPPSSESAERAPKGPSGENLRTWRASSQRASRSYWAGRLKLRARVSGRTWIPSTHFRTLAVSPNATHKLIGQFWPRRVISGSDLLRRGRRTGRSSRRLRRCRRRRRCCRARKCCRARVYAVTRPRSLYFLQFTLSLGESLLHSPVSFVFHSLHPRGVGPQHLNVGAKLL